MSTESPDTPVGAAVAAPVIPAPSNIDIIRRYVMWSMAAGAVPVPIVDVAAVTGVQLKMISALADHYKSPFDSDRGKSLIGALFGTLGGMGIARGVLGSAIKSIPFVGTIGGFVLVPAMSGAVTYGLGKVFSAHFETGGTLLTFDAATMKDEFARQVKAGEEVVHELKDKVASGIK